MPSFNPKWNLLQIFFFRSMLHLTFNMEYKVMYYEGIKYLSYKISVQ